MTDHVKIAPLQDIVLFKDDPQTDWAFKVWLNNLWVKVSGIRSYTATLTPAEVSAGPIIEEQTFTVNGLKTTDNVIVNKPSADTYLGIVNARVSADNTLAIQFINVDTSAHTPSSEDYEITAIKRDLLS